MWFEIFGKPHWTISYNTTSLFCCFQIHPEWSGSGRIDCSRARSQTPAPSSSSPSWSHSPTSTKSRYHDLLHGPTKFGRFLAGGHEEWTGAVLDRNGSRSCNVHFIFKENLFAIHYPFLRRFWQFLGHNPVSLKVRFLEICVLIHRMHKVRFI